MTLLNVCDLFVTDVGKNVSVELITESLRLFRSLKLFTALDNILSSSLFKGQPITLLLLNLSLSCGLCCYRVNTVSNISF